MTAAAQTDRTLDAFIGECRRIAAGAGDAAATVDAIAPLMMKLLRSDRSFLRAEHFRSSPDHYTRNAIYISDDESLSLYALVWLPGQWTPVHDHGSWGVVGVLQGVLEERSYMSADGEIRADSGIRLKRGGTILLDHGSVTTFVPNPDHIHVTGVSPDRERVVSLHLYGRNMNSFHVYDIAAGTRRLIDVPHQKS